MVPSSVGLIDRLSSSPADCTSASSNPFSSEFELIVVVSRIVFRADVFQCRGPVAVTCATYSPDFAEFVSKTDIEHARYDGADPILGMAMRHQLYASGHLNSDQPKDLFQTLRLR